MSKKIITHVLYILDESGSMAADKSTIMKGFDTYIKELKSFNKKSKNEFRINLITFDSRGIRNPIKDKHYQSVQKLTSKEYEPAEMTPLYDAIGKTILKFKKKIKKVDKYTRVVMFVHTDGLENASKEFTKDTVKELVKQQNSKGWVITMLGADFDATTQAASVGTLTGNVLNYDKVRSSVLNTNLAQATVNYTGSNASGAELRDTSNWFDKYQTETIVDNEA